MKTLLCTTPKFGLFFAVAFLALQATPAAAADSGSGTFVGVIVEERASLTFKDVYAFRAEYPDKEQFTVVILSESPMDKKAMTGALRKERTVMALRMGPYLDHTAYARLVINQNGDVRGLHFFKPPSSNLGVSGVGKSDVKVNTAKRVEGRFFSDEKDARGGARKIDLRFAADLADVGPPVKE